MLRNQKHLLFLYLLGKCFAPTSPEESLGNRKRSKAIGLSSRGRARGIVSRPDCHISSQFPFPSSQLIHAPKLYFLKT